MQPRCEYGGFDDGMLRSIKAKKVSGSTHADHFGFENHSLLRVIHGLHDKFIVAARIHKDESLHNLGWSHFRKWYHCTNRCTSNKKGIIGDVQDALPFSEQILVRVRSGKRTQRETSEIPLNS